MKGKMSIADFRKSKDDVGYYDWIYNSIKRYLGRRICDFGAGTGDLSAKIQQKDLLMMVEVDPEQILFLRGRFHGESDVKILQVDPLDSSLSELKRYRFDTFLLINVLEHVTGDEKMIRNIQDVLNVRGCLIIMVPANKFLYGSMNERSGHLRRYSRKELINSVESAGFVVKKCFYFNILGILPWFVKGKILKKKELFFGNNRKWSLKIAPMVIRIFRYIEEIFPIPIGLSLICICYKE